MRRLLAAALLATAAFATATPASAVCTGTDPGVCVTPIRCVHGDCDLPSVDGHCTQGHPATLHCRLIDDLHVDVDDIVRSIGS